MSDTSFTFQGPEPLKEALRWALEMMEMYEDRLMEFGDPAHLVRSETHEAARGAAQALLATDPKEETELVRIKSRLIEFEDELADSRDPGDQFQVGYYVHHEDVRWLVETVERYRRNGA